MHVTIIHNFILIKQTSCTLERLMHVTFLNLFILFKLTSCTLVRLMHVTPDFVLSEGISCCRVVALGGKL